MNRRVVAMIAAALIPLAVLGVVIARRDGGKHSAARLPITVSGRTAEAGAGGATDAALAPYGVIVYHPGSGLPALDGTARAYRVVTPDTAVAARRIASALGLHGVPTPDPNGGFSLEDGTAQLSVTARGWSFAREPNASVSSGVATACPQDAPKCVPDDGVPPIPTRPADLPPQGAAKAAALALLERAGVDTTGADVSVDDGITQWYVTVEPVVDGIATQGLGYSVVVGDKGAIDSANGILGTAAAADEYPLSGTSAAIDRLNAGEGSVGPQPLEAAGDVASDVVAPPDASSVEPAEPSAAPIPDVPPEAESPQSEPPVTDTIPPPSQQDITLTGAERILLYATSADGNEGWLVPAYRFTTADGAGPTVIAVDEGFLTPATGR